MPIKEEAKLANKSDAIQDEKKDQLRFLRRSLIIIIGVISGILALLSRAYYLQVMRHDYYRTRSQKNRVKSQVIPPRRGNIFDRNGVPLSENILSYDLIVNRAKSNHHDTLVKQINQYMRFDDNDQTKYTADKRKKAFNQDVIVRSDLSEEEINRFSVDLYQFPGFEIIPAYKRYYPYGYLTSHVVGYINNINSKDQKKLDKKQYAGTVKIGRTGIEKQYESVLHGQAGFRQAEVTRTGKVIRILDKTDPIPGSDITLSLDLTLQKIISEELEKGEFDGAGVAIDPRNGEMLSLYSNPSFDANLFVNGISHKDYGRLRNSPRKNLFNRALHGQYAPASTIKPMMALAAMHNYVASAGTRINCRGFYRIPEYQQTKRFFCWKRSGHGNMNARSSIVQSCDVYYYTVGKELGIQRIHEYLSQFGLGEKTGVDLPNESTGILPNKAWKEKRYKKSWFIGDTINASIGQGYVTTTPLQLAYFTAILGAQGKRYKPHFTKYINNPVSGTEEITPIELPRVPQNNSQAWKTVHSAMVNVLHGTRGTARKTVVKLPFLIAGKTGTAQNFSFKNEKRIKKHNLKKHLRDNALFITYAPADNPVIALSILLENAGGGSESAAPVAARILERYFTEKKMTAATHKAQRKREIIKETKTQKNQKTQDKSHA